MYIIYHTHTHERMHARTYTMCKIRSSDLSEIHIELCKYWRYRSAKNRCCI